MTDKQLVALEARAEAEYRAEQISRMEPAMKAVNEVSRQHNHTGMTYGIVRKQIKAHVGIWPESMQPCKDG